MLLSYFSRSSQPTNDTVLYGDQDRPSLELRYSSSGRPLSLRPGPAFPANTLAELQKIVCEQVLSEGPIKIGRLVMFSSLPVAGWFRFHNEFQIVPVPPEAPRPEHIVGDHPFLLEVAYRGSVNNNVDMLRRTKRQREIELQCGLLLVPVVHAQSRLASFHWVFEPTNVGNFVSRFRQSGYHWVGGTFQADTFSLTDDLAPLAEREPQAYYTQRGIGAGDTLQVPTNLSQSLEKKFVPYRKMSASDLCEPATGTNSRSKPGPSLIQLASRLSFLQSKHLGLHHQKVSAYGKLSLILSIDLSPKYPRRINADFTNYDQPSAMVANCSMRTKWHGDLASRDQIKMLICETCLRSSEPR